MVNRRMRAGQALGMLLSESGKFPIKHKHDHTRDDPIVVTRTINGHKVTCTCTRESRYFDYAGWAFSEVRRWKIDGKPATKSQIWQQFGEEC
jgi:hypothetical protein